ncbi:MAG: PKD domain-containing protein, partial [Actinomycetes bacterium]
PQADAVDAAAGVLEAQPCHGADCGVVTDPHGAQYVGSGGLLLPANNFTGSDADRSDAATCTECRWALLPMCRGGDGQAGGVDCGGAASSCPPGQFRRIVMLLRPGDTDWREVGLVCLVGGAPTTVDDVADQLSDVVVEQVPDLEPSYQPKGGTLIGLPALFDAGQPRTLGERRFTLVGFDIELHGRATWTWAFGDGESLTTDDPGGAWPTTTVTHDYTHAGTYPVGVTAEWQAWFTVDGMGPWPVTGDPVVQEGGPLPLRVVEARAELVTG